jgi:E3 ubiquitin-protein ligase SIAH1
VRNITLEKNAAAALYPCKNSEAGCEETFTVDDRNKHKFVCLYESKECPFRKLSDVDCSWTGTVSDIAAHVRSDHSSETIQDLRHFGVKLLDISRKTRYRQAVLILGELFYLTWETGSDVFSFAVFHFGRKKEVEDIKYRIKIGNSEENVSMTRQSHSYLQGGLKNLQPGKCVTLHYGTLLEYLSESGDLLCEIEIGSNKLNGFVSEDMQECLPVVSLMYSKLHCSGRSNFVPRLGKSFHPFIQHFNQQL